MTTAPSTRPRERRSRWSWATSTAATIPEGRVDFDLKLAALLTLVRESTGNLGNVPAELWQAALDAGWSDVELTEVSAHIALNLFTNHFNHLVQTELDVPAAPGL